MMNILDQQRACAELDGWLDVKEYTYSYDYAGEKGEFKQLQGRELAELQTLKSLKDYFTYNHIIPLIQKRWSSFNSPTEIDDRLPVGVYFHNATPAQLVEALLRATNRWKE